MDPAQTQGVDLIQYSPNRIRARATQVGLSCALLVALSLFGSAQEDEVQSLGFSIPDTRAARALVDSVEGHLGARRWPEAVSGLQQIIRNHDGDLLGAKFDSEGQISQRPVHAGAAEYARRRLLGLPREAREVYVQAYEADARLLLDEALSRSDRAGLARVGTLYPLTPSATHAWCALGDLELELGNTTEALLAWNRALQQLFQDSEFRVRNRNDWGIAKRRLEGQTEPLAIALGKRVEFVLASYEGRHDGLSLSDAEILGTDGPDRYHSGNSEQLGREMRLPGPGEGVRSLPERNPGSWPEPFKLRSDHPFSGLTRTPLHAVRSGDLVLVSDSMRVSAVNAYSGLLVWESETAPGWDAYYDKVREWSSKERELNDFFAGLDERYSLIAPAASDSIVVAALQIPVTHSSNSKYTSINITRIIPSRRLFAFDLQTGKELWRHMPPIGWDGEAGSFEQRSRICGPPVIAGGRVLVPSYRLQGRIDFHVACYDLRTGERLWSTGLISGQRELNMFGRPERAFSAPPVRVEGDRVVVLTQLGSIAALDLFNGSILWETLYDQLRLQAAQLHANYRPATWRNAPPVISNGVVIATPVDSHDLIALDLESGAMLWSRDQATMRRSGGLRVDLLLGADLNTIYLAGTQIMALDSPTDLRTQPNEKWAVRRDSLSRHRQLPWPALAKDTILVPAEDEHFEISRILGQDEPGVAWNDDGNLLLTEGAFFTLSNRELNGYFEWGTLLKRARKEHRERPEELGPALSLANLLTDRGESQLEDSQADLARPFAEEAVAVLEPFLERSEPRPDEAFQAQLHESLRMLARVQKYVADPATLGTLRRARAYAPNRAELRDTLLEEQALLHDSRSEAWFEVLAILEDQCGDLELTCKAEPLAAGLAELEFEFIPRLKSMPDERGGGLELPVDLWVQIERSAANLRNGAYEAAFDDLHKIIGRHALVPLASGTAFELAEARIAAALSAGGGTGYERFEAAAQRSLERALTANSLESLKRVALLYPHSTAAREAQVQTLERSISSGNASAVARVLQAELLETWQPAKATQRDAKLLLSLANMLRDKGNLEYYRGVVKNLAAVLPETQVDVPGLTGKTLAVLEDELPPAVQQQPASETATFDSRCSKMASFDGMWNFHGYAPGATPEQEKLRQVAIFSSKEAVMALSSNDPSKPLWVFEFDKTRRRELAEHQVAFSEGRVILYTDDWIIGLNREDGLQKWRWESRRDEMSEIHCQDGVLLAIMTPKASDPIMHAFDAQWGDELWELRISEPGLLPRMPRTGSGRMVFLPNTNRSLVVVRDLFTSRKISEFKLPRPAERDTYSQVWIEDNLLIEPLFMRSQRSSTNHVTAYNLDTGEQEWQESFDEQGRRELTSIVRYEGIQYLLLRPRSRSDHQELPGQIMRLHVGFGALQPVGNLELGKRDIPVDVTVRNVATTEAPYVFLRSSTDDESRTKIRAVHLPHGERWVHTLPVAESDIYPRITPPALSDTTVALAYNEWPQDSPMAGITRLRFIDRASGVVKDARDLPQAAFPRADSLRLVTLGPALLLVGPNRIDVLE